MVYDPKALGFSSLLGGAFRVFALIFSVVGFTAGMRSPLMMLHGWRLSCMFCIRCTIMLGRLVLCELLFSRLVTS